MYNQPKRIHPIIYALIINKFATYYELKYKYDIYEILDLYEVCMVSLYNKNLTLSNKN